MCFPPLIATNNSLESRAIGPILQTRKLRLKEVNLPAQDATTGISAPGTEILSPDSPLLCRSHGSGSSSPEAGPQPVGTQCGWEDVGQARTHSKKPMLRGIWETLCLMSFCTGQNCGHEHGPGQPRALALLVVPSVTSPSRILLHGSSSKEQTQLLLPSECLFPLSCEH